VRTVQNKVLYKLILTNLHNIWIFISAIIEEYALNS
jgi:hypothetical protein